MVGKLHIVTGILAQTGHAAGRRRGRSVRQVSKATFSVGQVNRRPPHPPPQNGCDQSVVPLAWPLVVQRSKPISRGASFDADTTDGRRWAGLGM